MKLTLDEAIRNPILKMKVEVFFQVIDSLLSQIEDRFSEHSRTMIREMSIFTHQGVLKAADEADANVELDSKSIEDLCNFYKLDSDIIASEMNIFSRLYEVGNSSINLADVLPSKYVTRENAGNNDYKYSDSESDVDIDDKQRTAANEFL